MKKVILFLLIFLFICINICISAEMRYHSGFYNSAIIEGEIDEGDYERFKILIFENGVKTNRVVIANPGGNVLEAMRIGRLIRELNLTTTASSKDNSLCKNLDIGYQDCTCQSACLLIHAGGIHRSGDQIGVHRGFYSGGTKDLSLTQSANISAKVNRKIEMYLSEMGLPDSLIEDVIYTPSSEIYWLEEKKIEKFLSGYIPEVKNWFDNKCKDDLEFALKANEQNLKEQHLATKFYLDCLKQSQEQSTYDSFFKFAKNEYEQCAGFQDGFDIRNILGFPLEQANAYLKCFGVSKNFSKQTKDRNTDKNPNGQKKIDKEHLGFDPTKGELVAETYYSNDGSVEILHNILSNKITEIYLELWGFDYELFDGIRRGMSFEDVTKKFGKPEIGKILDKDGDVPEEPWVMYKTKGLLYTFIFYKPTGAVESVRIDLLRGGK